MTCFLSIYLVRKNYVKTGGGKLSLSVYIVKIVGHEKSSAIAGQGVSKGLASFENPSITV